MTGDSLNQAVFIWDLDGTLLDSYDIIVDSLYKTYLEFGTELDKNEIRREVIRYTVGAFITKTEKSTGLQYDAVRKRFSEINDSQKLNIKPMLHAAEILHYLKSQGSRNFVFTHKGKSAEPVLRNTGLYDYFEEIVTGVDGFPKKPDPSALNFLVQKHGLDRNKTFYVGDRRIDIECAVNAKIKSILFLPENNVTEPTGDECYIVSDLLEIKAIAKEYGNL